MPIAKWKPVTVTLLLLVSLVIGKDPDPRDKILLKDPNPTIRLQAALALGKARDPAAIPVLIDLLGELVPAQRTEVEDFLHELAGEWAPMAGPGGEDEISRRIRRDAWAAWWKNTDGPALIGALRKRTLTATEGDRVRGLIRKMGHVKYTIREQAMNELSSLGPMVLPLLRTALRDPDQEIVQRAEQCIRKIKEDPRRRLPSAIFRLLVLRKPPQASDALLAFLPFADDEFQVTEVKDALTALAVRDGKTDPALVRALGDADPLLRGTAAEVLARGGGPDIRPAVLKLLNDPNPAVRLRASLGLITARERKAVPVLIELLALLPADQMGTAEDMLYQLAGEKAPTLPDRFTEEGRKKYREAWAAWWKDQGAKIDMPRLDLNPQWLGYTLIVEANGPGGGFGRVLELGRDGKPRWTITNLQFPVDAVVLAGRKVLIAEFNGNCVTERDFTGKIVWEKRGLPGQPVNVQRLPNGNTFIATTVQLMEVDRKGNVVWSNRTLGPISAAYKTRNNQIICLTQNNQCIRLDASGKQLKNFISNRPGGGWTSGLDLLANGHILITQPNIHKVSEFDANGKLLLEVNAQQVTTATALPNGHILAASFNMRRAFEMDRKGKMTWEYQATGALFRARKR